MATTPQPTPPRNPQQSNPGSQQPSPSSPHSQHSQHSPSQPGQGQPHSPERTQNPPQQPPQPPRQQQTHQVSPNSASEGETRTQKQVDNEKRAKGTGEWHKNEGDVVGEKPASIDFVGSYDWPNVCEPGENRDDDTPTLPPSNREYDLQRLEMEDKLAADERTRTIERQQKAKEKFKQQLADGTAPPPYAHRQLEEDSQQHGTNKPPNQPVNRPAA